MRNVTFFVYCASMMSGGKALDAVFILLITKERYIQCNEHYSMNYCVSDQQLLLQLEPY